MKSVIKRSKKEASRISRWSKLDLRDMKIHVPGSRISEITEKRTKMQKTCFKIFIMTLSYSKNSNLECKFNFDISLKVKSVHFILEKMIIRLGTWDLNKSKTGRKVRNTYLDWFKLSFYDEIFECLYYIRKWDTEKVLKLLVAQRHVASARA